MARGKSKNQIKGKFVPLSHDLIKHKNFQSLSGNAVKLFIQLLCQFNGSNNGDYSCPYSTMQHMGWKSSGTLQNSIDELIKLGFIVKTRQGGRNRCNLYGDTLHPLDECKGKLDAGFANAKTFIGNWHKS